MSKFEPKQAAWEYYLKLDSHHFEERQHNNIYTDAFEAGAEWEHKRLVEKACDWLVGNAEDSVESALYLVAKFKRAMEE